MIKNIFASLLLFICMGVHAQKQDPIIQKLDELLFGSQFEEVITQVDQYKTTDLSLQMVLENKKAEALIRWGKFEDADTLLKVILEKIKSSKNSEVLVAITETNIGFLYLNQGRNDLALETLIHAVSSLQQGTNNLATAQALTYLGQVYLNTGKYSQAEEQQLMALSLRKDVLPETHELIAASYNDLGLIYTSIDLDKALDNYEMATSMYEKLHGKDHQKLAIANSNLGVVYLYLELYGDAINYFETSLKIWEKIYPQPHPAKAFVLRYLGETYSKMNNQTTALEYYNKALQMYLVADGKKHPDVAYMYTLIGNIEKSQNKFDDALVNYQKSLIANISDFNDENYLVNPKGKNFYSGTQLLYSLMYKAEVLEARFLGKTLKTTDLTLGLTTLQVGDSLIDLLRQQTTNEADKITLGSIANEVYADGVRIAHMLSEVAFKHRTEYREQSFYFAEKSKSAVLQEAIADANAKSFANIPADLLEEEKSLKSAMALVTQKLSQKPSDDEEKYLRETAFHLNTAYSEFTLQLEKNYPEYFNLKFNSSAPSIAQLQELLNEKTALLSYFIDEKNNRLYIYLLTHKHFSITDQSLPADYDKYLNGFRNSMYFSDQKTFILSSRNLYKLLIPKGLSSAIDNLVILPSGRMSIVPFEALLTQPVKDIQTSFVKLPYLLKKHSIRYEFSAGLLLQKKRSSSNTVITSARLLAPVSFPEKDNLNALPGTEKEVNEISNLFKEKNISCEVLLHGLASETAMKDGTLQNYSLVHLATHGIVDEDNPELSRIYLQNNTEAEDGNLYAGEIYNLQLNANLVSLSACQTGLGKISKGEGVIGLSRALVYAGAKNIIVSFWSVADESTAELMTTFYQNLLQQQNETFSSGLREAKLKMIDKGTYASPYYWAPFILIGF
ncbi:MAG: CHAT domain-containing protein [Cyclobacteriaceae bacterium]|jgi:CHAT domain-containing protein|nr:CHAT domain-containing protein [Cyclobacteriaceae bacterium]